MNCLICGMTGGGGGRAKGSKSKLEKEKKDALYEKAKKYNIKGRSKMTKQQLVDAIRARHAKVGESIAKRGKK